MDQVPLVSVIIATKNRAKYIKKAVDSVLNQSYKNVEIIIIDGSTNNDTEEVIKPYLKNSPVIYFRQKETEKNPKRWGENLIKAWNKGMEISKGKYIAILDDDDFWCDEKKLEKQVKFLEENPDYVACGGGVVRIFQYDKKRPYVYALPIEKDSEIKENMLLSLGFCTHSTLVFRRDIGWEKAGGYSIKNPDNEDCEFMMRLGTFGKLYNFPEYFTCVLIGEQNLLNFRKHKWKRLMANLKLIIEYRRIYPHYLKAIFFNIFYSFYSFLPLVIRSPLRSIFRKVTIFSRKK